MMVNIYIYWLVVGIPTPLKNDGVKVSWDDDDSQLNGKIKHVSNHQPVVDVMAKDDE